MEGKALLAVGAHLEALAQLVKSQVASDIRVSAQQMEEFCAALARSSESLSTQVPFDLAANDEQSFQASTPVVGSVDASKMPETERVKPDPIAVMDTSVSQSQHTDGSQSLHQSPATESATKSTRAGAIFDTRRHISTAEHPWLKLLEEMMTQWPSIEAFFAFLILLNVILMILQAQNDGAKVGYSLGIYGRYGSKDWIEGAGFIAADWFYDGAEVVFGVLFTIELILRLVALRLDFLRDFWGWLDIVVVVVTDVALLVKSEMMNPSILRALRLVRLLRIVKLVRKIQTFDSLYLMTTALRGSLSVLLWVCVLLFVIQTLCALLLTNIVQSFYLTCDDNPGAHCLPKTDQEEIYIYFGTYWRGMVSLFELMLANWPPICRLMMEKMHEPWSLAVVVYKLTMGLAVIGVIFGVFTQETFRAAESDDQLMLRKKKTQARTQARKLKWLFSHMVDSEDAEVDLDQFASFLQDEEVSLWLKAMDYDVSDAELLFYLIDKDGSGTVSLEELVGGMSALKGGSRNIDVKLLVRQSPVLLRAKQQAAQDGPEARRHSIASALKEIESAPSPTGFEDTAVTSAHLGLDYKPQPRS